MILKKMRFLTPVVLTVLAAFLAGCASLPVRNRTGLLRLRAEQIMKAKVAGDWATVYDILEPAFRGKVPKKAFVNRTRNILFKGFKIKELQLMPSGKQATIKAAYDISMRGYDFKDAPEVQHWVFEEGQWYLKMKPHANPVKNK